MWTSLEVILSALAGAAIGGPIAIAIAYFNFSRDARRSADPGVDPRALALELLLFTGGPLGCLGAIVGAVVGAVVGALVAW